MYEQKEKKILSSLIPKRLDQSTQGKCTQPAKVREEDLAKSLDFEVASDWVRCCYARDFRANQKV